MGLLEDTGEYPTLGPGEGAGQGLDPFKGFILGERLDLRPDPGPHNPFSVTIRRDRCLGGVTIEQPAIEVNEAPKRRSPAAFIMNALTRMADSRVIDSLERRIFK